MEFVVLALVSFAAAAAAAEYTEDQKAGLKRLYVDKCALCHGVDGKAQTWSGKLLEIPNQADPQWQNSVTDEQLIASITNGKGKMPPWSDELSAEQVRGLVRVVIRGFAPAR